MSIYIRSCFLSTKKTLLKSEKKKVAFRFSSPRKAVVRPWPYQSVFCIADYQMRNVNVRSVNSKRRKTPSSSCLWVSQFRCFVTNSTYDNYTVLYKPDYIVIILLYYIILYIYIYIWRCCNGSRRTLTFDLAFIYTYISIYIYRHIFSLYVTYNLHTDILCDHTRYTLTYTTACLAYFVNYATDTCGTDGNSWPSREIFQKFCGFFH